MEEDIVDREWADIRIENVLEKRGRGEHASRGDGYGNRGEVRVRGGKAGREGGVGAKKDDIVGRESWVIEFLAFVVVATSCRGRAT